ncbi:DUF6443 domain-containing protein [Psychroserpens damuponensis]|uniref:DUF6443 domain-containing protein n=1 Tax=Psychroserpens damuponensis TaxID=943936 RepID=UPI000693623C|nr:DUF6443 domain-containing protein [Psychroserpens damuponensis]
MKNLLITLAFVLVSFTVLAQTTTENYVKSTSYKVKTTDGEHKVGTSTDLVNDEKIETITYLDGLGRPKQSISKQAGGNKENIITPIIYDDLGRQIKDYLPTFTQLTNNALNYVDNINLILNQENQYLQKYPEENWLNLADVNAYSQKHFENSPLNRVLEQGAPGKDWQVDQVNDTDHTIKFEYQTNTIEKVEMFSVIFPTLDTEQPQLFYEGTYGANELYKTITKDENWQPSQMYLKDHTTEEFKNSLGQVILKRTYNEDIEHNTYYVYDDFENLTYVLSPKGSDLVLSSQGYKGFSSINKSSALIPTNKHGEPITTGNGTININVNGSANTFTVDFDVSFDSSIDLAKGAVVQLNQNIPNMILGTILNGNYTVSVQNGYLYIAGSGATTSINETIVANLPNTIIVEEHIDDLCYQYHYDKRNRLIEKKIPQKGWEYIVYDKLDRPILTQDALQRAKSPKGWSFTKYDKFDRIAYTGIVNNNYSRHNLQDTASSQTQLSVEQSSSASTIDGMSVYYSNDVYPSNNLTLLTVNYYDSYNATLTNALPNPGTIYGKTISSDTKTLATGSLVLVLGTTDWITSVTYYDEKAQPIYIGSDNAYLNTKDVIKTDLNFIGTVLETESSHIKGTNSAIIITDRFTYDHANRLLTQKQQITGQPEELIIKNEYDELGQLKIKNVGNTETTPLQTVDYIYNIRGWLKQINEPTSLGDDLFAFKINYNTIELAGNSVSKKLYNGNISETIWQTVNDATDLVDYRGYYYEYDALNRINWAHYRRSTPGQNGHYNLKNVQYDKNGNILSLGRTGINNDGWFSGGMDNLVYSYSGNQLDDVTENGNNTIGFTDTAGSQIGDYEYDTNGNMVVDKNKSISSIEYNHLNLPTFIVSSDPNEGQLYYIYDATGVKLEKRMESYNGDISTTAYAGNFIYEKHGAEDVLKFFSHPEGYVEPSNNGGYDYVYQYKDHLGNIRLSYSDLNSNGTIEASSEILEENNYYPFGLRHKGYNNVINGTDHPYGFGGKEEQDELGLGWMDVTARNYDPALGRWMNIDPLAQKMPTYSPYNYAFDNPINFIDEDGEFPIPAWAIKIAVSATIKSIVKVTIGKKIAKIDNELQDVKSEISSKTTEMRNIRTGRTADSPVFEGGYGGGGYSGAGAGDSFGSPMSKEEAKSAQQESDKRFKEDNPEGYEKIKSLESEINDLQKEADVLDKKIEKIEKIQSLVRATDPDKIADEVAQEVFPDLYTLYKTIKEKINDDVKRRNTEEETP